MNFTSFDFAIFLPIVFLLYWFVFNRNLHAQNSFVVIASYVFYGWWDIRFLALIFISSLIDYYIGKKIFRTKNRRGRKSLLVLSLLINLGILGFFKYYNFFVSSFADAFLFFGMEFKVSSLNIVLPVGISFYTFQTLSYSIDVYRGNLKPANNLTSFLAFVSFFPQLVAGPIERAVNLLPQFEKPRIFRYENAVDGCRQILWGLFKKVVVADNCAEIANLIFSDYTNFNGITLFAGGLFFTFQIYGDFSGYSDIAIGLSRLFGFDLMKNFNYPYFSRDIGEFWRRWHISLSSWFRDYVYIPLGGSRVSKLRQLYNTFVIFIVSGLWHGANWTFVLWGLINAFFFIPLLLLGRNRNNLDVIAQNSSLPKLREFVGMVFTFLITVFAWIFFRSNSIHEAIEYIKNIFNSSFFEMPQLTTKEFIVFVFVFFLFLVEWMGRRKNYGIEEIHLQFPKVITWSLYLLIMLCIAIYAGTPQEFIYFQF